MKGIFVTFEGIEGCGKSTQAFYLYERLLNNRYPVILTREPGGTEAGTKIRNILLESHSLAPLTELFLFLADRNQHIRELIIPSIENGIIVICDRFYHSTYAYQAGGRRVSIETVKRLNEIALEGLKPDLTFLIDVPVETGFNRKKSENLNLDRIEKEDFEFHNSIRNAYLEMAKSDSNIILINGLKSKEEIKAEIFETFKNKFQAFLKKR